MNGSAISSSLGFCYQSFEALDFPWRFRSSTLAISDEGMDRRHERTLELGGVSRSANLICI
ncbi:hypothetical protein RMSM_00664 [Rhodopirellula maiorica SM1]|uniref:Uncharacterized protein n=1 Tax=Rhodopirellula maiorica SM1 TaxID=1265738 RepID=M5S8C0_9BACT|nr:hypothetical protein RMSM_00664 [Rhodopirellula maiorica SM1]